MKPVLQYTLAGELVTEFPSAYAAGRSLAKPEGTIAAVCRGRPGNVTAYGFLWRFKSTA
jgi:hypothetical protein